MLKICERFGKLPSEVDVEPTTLRGGRPGLLKLLVIEKMGTAEPQPDDSEGW